MEIYKGSIVHRISTWYMAYPPQKTNSCAWLRDTICGIILGAMFIIVCLFVLVVDVVIFMATGRSIYYTLIFHNKEDLPGGEESRKAIALVPWWRFRGISIPQVALLMGLLVGIYFAWPVIWLIVSHSTLVKIYLGLLWITGFCLLIWLFYKSVKWIREEEEDTVNFLYEFILSIKQKTCFHITYVERPTE